MFGCENSTYRKMIDFHVSNVLCTARLCLWVTAYTLCKLNLRTIICNLYQKLVRVSGHTVPHYHLLKYKVWSAPHITSCHQRHQPSHASGHQDRRERPTRYSRYTASALSHVSVVRHTSRHTRAHT